ncbi:MAG TPA: hypothetical protein VNL94_06735 [Candidatus Binatia bacterium]|nr:hypothetical protein [Candidatus Binatia bacterium]
MDDWFWLWLADFRADLRAKEAKASTKASKTGDKTMAKKTPKAAIVAAALAIALAIPASALAAGTGQTDETLNKPATIALVVPASASYAYNAGDSTATLNVSGIETDNPSGLTITLAANPTGDGSLVNPIPRSQRSSSAVTASAGLAGANAVSIGGMWQSSGQINFATSGGAVSGGTASITMHVNSSGMAPGVYHGRLDWAATTNP